jgi:transcription antitermination factor NusG
VRDQSPIPFEFVDALEGRDAVLGSSAETTLTPIAAAATSARPSSWYALWTHSHCEQLVYDQLIGKGFAAFLPKVDLWSRRRGVRRLVQAPMFPGYLFLRHAMDKTAYLDASKVRGLARVLGERWDRLVVIPEEEMVAIERVAAARQPVLPFPYLKEGQRARITSGPLSGLEGLLVEAKPDKGLLVLSVHLLQRSVAVAVDGTDVVPA